MPSEETTVAKTTEAASHGAELSAEEAAQRLDKLGTDGEHADPKPEPKPEGDAVPETEPAEEQEAETPEAETPEEVEAKEQTIPKARLDHEIEKRRKATERAEALERERDELKRGLDDQAASVAERLAVHPDYLAPEDRKLILRANELEQEVERLSEHPEGIEDEDPKRAMTPQQVSVARARAQNELMRISPRADSAYREARKQMIEDLQVGRKIRAEKESARKADPDPAKRKLNAAAPMKAATPAARTIGTPPDRKPDPLKVFREKGKTPEAAAAALALL